MSDLGQEPSTLQAVDAARSFAEMLRALREGRGISQDGWAARLGYSRKSVHRWEHGETLPDEAAEETILSVAHETGAFRRIVSGPFAGVTLSEGLVRDALAAARLAVSHGSGGRRPPHPPAAESASRSTLPSPLTGLVGRDEEIAAVAGMLERARLLTLTGPGGTGKTRLALAVAERVGDRYDGGVCFVDLSSLTDPSLVPSAIAQTLGVVEGESSPPREVLVRALAGKRLLLVLDNVEQVVEAAPFVRDLLITVLGLTVLATSRVPLRIGGEREYAVSPLPLPGAHASDPATLAENAAVALLVQRTQDVDAGFALTGENAKAIAEICVRLDGLPLALELAAARLRLLSPAALNARLEQRLPLLTSGGRDAPARQRTLRDAIGWSYDLATEAQRQLFCRLSVFAGGFTPSTAAFVTVAALSGAEEDATARSQHATLDVLDGLEALLEQSLLRRERDADDAEEGRFGMLATIREFAAERLAASGEERTVRAAHAAHFLALAERAEPELRGPSQVTWLDRLEREHDNLRAALGWLLERGDGERSLRMAGALWWFWWVRSHYSEGRTWLDRALAADSGTHAARALALEGSGWLASSQGDHERGLNLLEQSVALRRDKGELRDIIRALNWYGNGLFRAMRLDESREVHTEVLNLRREVGDESGAGASLCNLGIVAFMRGDFDEAAALLEEALPVTQRLGDEYGLNVSFSFLAHASLARGDVEAAEAYMREGLPYWRRVRRGHAPMNSLLLRLAAALAHERGDLLLAARLYGCAAANDERLDNWSVQKVVEENLGAERRCQELRTVLGADGFDAAFREGRVVSWDAAIELALEQLGPPDRMSDRDEVQHSGGGSD